MLTEQIISDVYKIYNLDHIPENIDGKEVQAAMKHRAFYVRPGWQTELFDKAFANALKTGKDLGTILYAQQKGKGTLKETQAFCVSCILVGIIQTHLDKDFFNAQICKFRSGSPEGKALLQEHLLALSKEQLQNFVEILTNFNSIFLFITDGHGYDLNSELNAKCLAVDPKVPQMQDETFTDFYTSTAELFADYYGREFEFLSPDVIAETLLKYIDNEFYILGRVAEILHTQPENGYEVAMEYISSCSPTPDVFS